MIWSQAWTEMQCASSRRRAFPFYTTPQGRGVVPDDHPLSFLTMRSTAFKDADLIIILGTRMNYVIGHAAPPRFGANAKIARIDIDADEIASAPRKIDIAIVGDCKAVLQQLIDRSCRAESIRKTSRIGARSSPKARRRRKRRPAAACR